jgi:hypothetical protein
MLHSEYGRRDERACPGDRAPPASLRDEAHRAMESSLSARLAGIVLPDADGSPIQLGSLWAEQPAVLVFLRHYG